MALKYHVPFIGMPYEVWQAGPVAKDVFIDLSDVPYILKGFVRTEFRDGGIFIEANLRRALDEVKPFCIDLSSAVETHGVKDYNKIKEIAEIMKK